MKKLKNFKLASAASEVGLVLFDQSRKPIAFDRGAAGILNYPDSPNGQTELASYIPSEMWDLIGRQQSSTSTAARTCLRGGDVEYSCRAYLVESSSEALANPIVAVLLEKMRSTHDVVQEISSERSFTDREREILFEFSRGFTTNQIAERLKISPNTVRSFIRVIMTKMGVKQRSEIIAALLQPKLRARKAVKGETVSKGRRVVKR